MLVIPRYAILVLVAMLLVSLLHVLPASAKGQIVGKLSITREVMMTKATVDKGLEWVPAKQNDAVRDSFGVRTLKRSRAEIAFLDKSVLRLNERTDLVVEEVEKMRRVKLTSGAVWVHVVKGANTSVETPTATAMSLGTIYVVLVLKDGRTRIVVLEGRVQVTAGGKTVTVDAGQFIETNADGQPNETQQIPTADRPVEQGGSTQGWWGDVINGVETAVTPGSPIAQELRTTPYNDEANGIDVIPAWFITDSTLRESFMLIANNEVVPTIQAELDQGLSLVEFRATYGAQDLSYFTSLSLANRQFYEVELCITTVDQLVASLLANGGTLTMNVRGRQSVYRPGASPTTGSLRLIDRTESSTAVLLAGLGAGLALDAKHLSISRPSLGGMVFGFSGNPGFIGGRGDASGVIGQTRYYLESNALKFTNDPASEWVTRLASSAYVERTVGLNWTVFAGRQRFFAGPVFQNQVSSQLIADRYSGAGIRGDYGRWSLESAWLYDSNPEVAGAQRGALASLYYHLKGGILGVHALEATAVESGHGHTASIVYPVLPHKLDIYGEVGQGVDGANLQTYGMYFPALYQKTDVDLFLEYGRHEGVGHALSLVACKQYTDRLELRGYINRLNTSTFIGMGGIWRFGKGGEGHVGDSLYSQ